MLTGKPKSQGYGNPVLSIIIYMNILLNYYKSQETIPTGSTMEDELPLEVRIIRLPIESDKDIVHPT